EQVFVQNFDSLLVGLHDQDVIKTLAGMFGQGGAGFAGKDFDLGAALSCVGDVMEKRFLAGRQVGDGRVSLEKVQPVEGTRVGGNGPNFQADHADGRLGPHAG